MGTGGSGQAPWTSSGLTTAYLVRQVGAQGMVTQHQGFGHLCRQSTVSARLAPAGSPCLPQPDQALPRAAG